LETTKEKLGQIKTNLKGGVDCAYLCFLEVLDFSKEKTGIGTLMEKSLRGKFFGVNISLRGNWEV